MNYRQLGKTDLNVSAISLGTAALGMDYGLKAPGELDRPTEADAIRLIQEAADYGINLLDTAPGYGRSEDLLGKAISTRSDCYIATKVSIPASDKKLLCGKDLNQRINYSLERSMRTLRRDVLDIVQIHNATDEIMKQGEITEILIEARKSGKIRFIGISVYGEEAALTAVELGCFDLIQVAYSLLDQRMIRNVFPAAYSAGIGIINRSALLKGVLTSRTKYVPNKLKVLQQATKKIMKTFSISWDQLPQMALRFCLSSEFVHTVLLGVSNKQELDCAVNAASNGQLDKDKLKKAVNLALQDEILLNPSFWNIP